MYRPVTLETWMSGPARVIIAAMRGDGWHAAILDHPTDQVRADLSASGTPVDRATLYLHVLSQPMTDRPAGDRCWWSVPTQYCVRICRKSVAAEVDIRRQLL
jgi:hypothetical protein